MPYQRNNVVDLENFELEVWSNRGVDCEQCGHCAPANQSTAASNPVGCALANQSTM